jgi:putative transcriptional regulator
MSNIQEWRQVDHWEGEQLHYTSCGLDNIYLVGGYTKHQTNYGEGVSIVNVEGLHRAIAETIIASENLLSGAEIRFLRKEMRYTQQTLAEYVKVDAQTVARWEKDEFAIPGSADIVVRALYKQYQGKAPNVKKLSEQLHELEHSTPRNMVFESTDLLAA